MIERAIILPFGENFNENNAGAAGLFVKESLNNNLIEENKKKSIKDQKQRLDIFLISSTLKTSKNNLVRI